MALGPMQFENVTDWTDIKKSGITNGTVEYKKVGDVVTLRIILSNVTTSYVVYGTIPLDARPSRDSYCAGIVGGGSAPLSTVWISASTGEIKIANSTAGGCFATITYLV